MSFEWITRWWREGDGSRERVLCEEKKLREAVEAHTKQSLRATVVSELETERTRTLIRTVEKTIEGIKTEE